jgi:hypothetical protein
MAQSQSHGLSERHMVFRQEGHSLNDDSIISEGNLNSALRDTVIPHAQMLAAGRGATIEHVNKMTLFECQEIYHKVGGPPPDPINKRVFMKPDGGIIFMVKDGIRTPLLISEDKVQGTNDTRLIQGLRRQATGNALERAAKNIRMAEMVFAGQDVFSYALFASGCDMHPTETISKRLEMMNMGFPNHYTNVSPQGTTHVTSTPIKINKINGHGIASMFVKGHKWDEMPHGTSRWTADEYASRCTKMIELVLAQ